MKSGAFIHSRDSGPVHKWLRRYASVLVLVLVLAGGYVFKATSATMVDSTERIASMSIALVLSAADQVTGAESSPRLSVDIKAFSAGRGFSRPFIPFGADLPLKDLALVVNGEPQAGGLFLMKDIQIASVSIEDFQLPLGQSTFQANATIDPSAIQLIDGRKVITLPLFFRATRVPLAPLKAEFFFEARHTSPDISVEVRRLPAPDWIMIPREEFKRAGITYQYDLPSMAMTVQLPTELISRADIRLSVSYSE